MRLGEPEMAALMVSHHRPGFYLRVVWEGRIQAGEETVKTSTGPGSLSVADTDALLYLPHRDQAPCAHRTVRRAGADQPGRRRHAQLKYWRILHKLRCGPHRAGRLAKAIHVLQNHEAAAG
jgi:MOSC domain-containing protein YiiM